MRTAADHRNPQPSIHSSLSREERACHSHWKGKAPLQTVHVHHLRTRWPLYLLHSRSAVPSSVQTAFQGLYSTPDNQTEYNDGARNNSCGSRHQRNFPIESGFFSLSDYSGYAPGQFALLCCSCTLVFRGSAASRHLVFLFAVLCATHTCHPCIHPIHFPPTTSIDGIQFISSPHRKTQNKTKQF